MKQHRILFAVGALLMSALVGCSSFTRTEKDVHTITRHDTVVTERVQNPPGDRANGVIYPSSRVISYDRNVLQHDSVVTREYPNFIRLALFESVGLAFSGQGGHSLNRGVFGIQFDIDEYLFGNPPDTTSSQLFVGAIYRFGIAEWRLRWFDDDPDWSWGITAYELMQPDASSDHRLTGVGVLSVKKRFRIHDKIPYVSITPGMEFSAIMSQYVNPNVALEIGSIGGLNFRAYAGYTFGMQGLAGTGSGYSSGFVSFPYMGLGFTSFDFLNRQEETETEWKYHEHSAWEIGLVQFNFIGASNQVASIFSPDKTGDSASKLTGFTARVGNAMLALPFLDQHIAIGTSLFNGVMLGATGYGIGVLPIRLSGWFNVFSDNIAVEPFVEYNYTPSQFSHVGARIAFPVGDNTTLQFVAGYASGVTGSAKGYDSGGQPFNPTEFSGFYLGIGAGLFDKIFHRSELRYGKGYPHE
ncbi:MAG: hypothetical protein JSS89_09790 [Bacteroidetes bacterium]|nr:hypothetical protein [Bacteroidota bacterium]